MNQNLQSALLSGNVKNTKLSTPLSERKNIYPLSSIDTADQILKDRLQEVYTSITSIFGLKNIKLYLYGSQRSGRRSKSTGSPDIDIMVYHPSFIDGPRIRTEVYLKLRDISVVTPFKVDISCHIKPMDNTPAFLRVF